MWQKASFILLLFIAGCLAFLVTRELARRREQASTPVLAPPAALVPERPAPAADLPSNSPPKPVYAPLRPRADPDVVRVVTNRIPVVVRTNYPVARDPEAALVPAVALASRTVSAPVPVAYTSGTTGGRAGGVISGRVFLRGTPPPEKIITLDAACGRLPPPNSVLTTRHYQVGADGGLANVFVYISSGTLKGGPQESVPVLDNVNCEFQPYVLGVRAGQIFRIRNSDPLLHNFHLMPTPGSGNPEFNLALPVKGMRVPKVIERPEVVAKVKCDVHPWMFAYLGVMDHPWFAVTDRNGSFALPPGLPAGSHQLVFKHLKAGERLQTVSVGAGDIAPLEIGFDVPENVSGHNPP